MLTGGEPTADAWAPGRPAMIPDRVLNLDVPAIPEQVAQVRHAVTDHLRQQGVSPAVAEDVELVTSELVTNAIIHPRSCGPGSRVLVRIVVADSVKVTVANRGSVIDIPPVDEWSPAPPRAMTGRGLGIVRRLSDVVAVEQRGGLAVVSCGRHLSDGETS